MRITGDAAVKTGLEGFVGHLILGLAMAGGARPELGQPFRDLLAGEELTRLAGSWLRRREDKGMQILSKFDDDVGWRRSMDPTSSTEIQVFGRSGRPEGGADGETVADDVGEVSSKGQI